MFAAASDPWLRALHPDPGRGPHRHGLALTPGALEPIRLLSMMRYGRVSPAALLLIGVACCFGPHPARAAPELMIGAGTTLWPWHWTDGIVIPLLVEIADSRFELGAFRFATRQYLKSPGWPIGTVSAHPYWGFSAMRRWQVLHRSRFKLYLGLGAAYRSETDLLEASKWNFAYVVAIRYSPTSDVFLEACARHWSDAWTRLPNRGQNMVLLTVGFH